MVLTAQKRSLMEKVSDKNGVISALAFDQRGALKKMMAKYQTEEPTVEQIVTLKTIVSEELTKYASSILLDPEYGLPASKARADEAGLLLAYEKTGYDATTTDRLPDCLVEWSVKRIKEQGFVADNPYQPWIDVFASDEFQAITAQNEAQINTLLAQANPAQADKFQQLFNTASRMEVNFWQQALDLS